MKNQTPETAMNGNKAWFEQKGIKSTTFTYPKSAKGFEEGKTYAWMVKSGNTESEVWEISMMKKVSQIGLNKITLHI
ncbi:MAG: hypothetical protein IPM96_16735 [Ignavibacteria bacterium]|nr:hypothetical protein [Ignavibacteria bacterium]